MLNYGQAPGSVNKELLDELFFQRFDYLGRPESAGASDPMVFKQKSTNTAAHTLKTVAGAGLWAKTAELQDRNEDTIFEGNAKTYNIEKWTNALNISREYLSLIHI